MATVNLCLDSNILIDHLKGREPGSHALDRALREYQCGITVITEYEMLYGMARSRRSIGEEALTSALTTLPLDKKAAGIAAHLHAELIHRNKDIGVKDTLISAICLRYSVPILTANIKHFSRVDGQATLFSPMPWIRSCRTI